MDIDFTTDNVKNPVYTENGDIDLEFNHPDFGWMPYTISESDPDSTIDNDALKHVANELGIKEYVAPEIPPEGEGVADIIGSL
jgi:hypothetical protein|tara:strand:+ start:648 stop:896 length:249 start_codon:yes stop_codon:yes gene_type:complete